MNYKKFLSKFMALSLAVTSCPAAVITAATAGSLGMTALAEETLTVTITSNQFRNDYISKAYTVGSYLKENEDGTFTRVEYVEGQKSVVIENLSFTDGVKVLSRVTIPNEMQLWGGCFMGENANFLVFANENRDEIKDKEIFRVVKYNKMWEPIGELSISDINTTIPMRSASLRMIEVNGQLYIYTSHQMFKTYDGINHQANLTLVVDEEKMEISQKFTDILNEDAGYISHSFNEFIACDGENLFRVDQGDAYPRSISLLKSPPDDIKKVQYRDAYKISGNIGANKTGVSIGGLELSKDNCIIAGNTVDMVNYNPDGMRNIFVNVTGKDMAESKTMLLTEYSESDNITVYTPHLVKKDDNNFVVMWNEIDGNKNAVTKYVCIDENGNKTSEIGTLDTMLSDCKPILLKNGRVAWYVTDGKTFKYAESNPFNVSDVPVEPDKPDTPDTPSTPSDGKVDYSKPYQDVLNEVIKSDAADVSYSLADINKDGTPELIVTTGKGSKNEKVDVYTVDTATGEAKKIGSASGTNSAILTDPVSGALIVVSDKDEEVVADKYVVNNGKLEKDENAQLTFIKEEGKTPAEQVSAATNFDRADTVEMTKTENGWESVKDIVADHAPVKTEGTDMSLFEDYAEEQKKPQYAGGYKGVINSLIDNNISELTYSLADINKDGEPELIVITDSPDDDMTRVSIYNIDKETGNAVQVIAISGEGLEVRINSITGSLMLIQTTETSINVNEFDTPEALTNPGEARYEFIHRVKGEDPNVTLAKELPCEYIDNVVMQKGETGWESTKNVTANLEPVVSTGTDMSLFDDYENKKAHPDYEGKYSALISQIVKDEVTHIDYSVADLDNNGVPELIAKSGTCEADYVTTIYTMAGPDRVTNVTDISAGHTTYMVDAETGQLVTVWAHMGDVEVTWYDYDGKEFTPVKGKSASFKLEGEDILEVKLTELGAFKRLDNVEAYKFDDQWTSTKNVTSNLQPVKSDGVDLTLFEDYKAKEAALGDVDGNGLVNAADASKVLVEYSLLSTGQDSSLTGAQTEIADVDRNGKVNAVDASYILRYYSFLSTGGVASMADFMRQ